MIVQVIFTGLLDGSHGYQEGSWGPWTPPPSSHFPALYPLQLVSPPNLVGLSLKRHLCLSRVPFLITLSI